MHRLKIWQQVVVEASFKHWCACPGFPDTMLSTETDWLTHNIASSHMDRREKEKQTGATPGRL